MQTYDYKYISKHLVCKGHLRQKSIIMLMLQSYSYLFVYTQPTSFQNSRTDAPIRSPIPTRIPIRLCPILSRNPAFLRYVTLVWLSMWWPGASGYYQITNGKLIHLKEYCFPYPISA